MEQAVRPEYGLYRPLIRLLDDGARKFGGTSPLRLRTGVPLEVDGESTIRASFTLGGGERAGFALRWLPLEARTQPEPTPADEVAERIADTAEAWRSWEADHDIYEGPHRDVVRHSSRVLKGLTYRPTGAIVAAPTTSLPETVGGERNWDYRFSWIRDSSLTLEALYVGACSDEAEDFVSFMTSSAGGRAGQGSLQIMYGIAGEHDLTERELPHLRGWRDSRPARVGNGAWGQTQLDVYGELLNSIWLYREKLGELHPEIQAFVADLADTAARRWKETGQGMWEMRGEPRHHLASKVLCWVALDRAVRLAPRLGMHAKVEEWSAARDEIRAAVLERGWSESRRAFAQSFDSDELDASQLLMPILGFLPATDERMRSTIEAIAADLTEDGLVLRYRTDEGRGRRRPQRRGGHVRDLLVLARLVPRQGRRGRPCREAVRQPRGLCQRPRTAGRGDRHEERRAARQLPPGLQPYRPDHRRVRDRQGPGDDPVANLGPSIGWGLVVALSLLAGAVAAARVRLSERVAATLTVFGGGVLFAAVALELVPEADAQAGVALTAAGLAAGTALYVGADAWVDRNAERSETRRMMHAAAVGHRMEMPAELARGESIAAGIFIDGVPESVALV